MQIVTSSYPHIPVHLSMSENCFIAVVFSMLAVTSCSNATEIVELKVVSKASTVSTELLLQTELPGSLIGNFDEVSNPEGTLTRPGLFGGSGNQPVEMDVTGILNGEIESQPVGSYQLDVDFDELAVSISELEMDVLGGDSGLLGVMLDLDFETFRTFQPDSLFLGVPITLPLGDAELTSLNFQQTGTALPAPLVPLGPNQYSFTLIVPATILIESEILGQPLSPPPFALAVMLNGELHLEGDQVTVTQSFEQMAADEFIDIPNGEFIDIPLPLPTVLPPGGTANLLFSGSVDSISFEVDLISTFTAQGEISSVLLGDLNGDGIVSLLDVALFVDAILDGTFVAAADINGDGAVNLEDVAPFEGLLVG